MKIFQNSKPCNWLKRTKLEQELSRLPQSPPFPVSLALGPFHSFKPCLFLPTSECAYQHGLGGEDETGREGWIGVGLGCRTKEFEPSKSVVLTGVSAPS